MIWLYNVQEGSQAAINAVKEGFMIGEPYPTCMAYPTVKRCKELGMVGVYSALPL